MLHRFPDSYTSDWTCPQWEIRFSSQVATWDTKLSILLVIQMGVSKNMFFPPKMDGENNGKPYEQMDDLRVPLFLETPKYYSRYFGYPVVPVKYCLFYFVDGYWLIGYPKSNITHLSKT